MLISLIAATIPLICLTKANVSEDHFKWSEPVKCIPKNDSKTDYCVYTSNEFASGRGISFFTTPAIIEKIKRLPAFTDIDVHKNINPPENPPWEVQNIQGRGNGLFATRQLQRGDTIISELPLGVYHTDALAPDSELGYIYLHTAFMQLPEPSQKLYLNTVGGSGDPIMERVNKNSFGAEMFGASHFLVYPETALINHDCRPNAMYYDDPKTLVHTTTVARTIEIGEEITIPYNNILASWRERQEALHAVWGFKCTCRHCSGTPLEIEASDKRLERILELQTILSDFDPGSVATTTMAEELIRLYEEENLYAAKATGHKVAALAYNAVGDTEAAQRHAKVALEVGMVSSGSDEYAEEMKILLKNPAAHWSWHVRVHDEL